MTTTTTNTTTTTSTRSLAPIKRYNFRERRPVVTGVEQRQRDQQQRDQGKGQGHDRGRGRTQSRGRLPPSLLGTSSPFRCSLRTRRHRHELSRRCRCRNRQRVGMDCVQGMLGVGCRRGRGQILSREGEGHGKCRIGFCFVCSFISVVVVSSLPVRYWDPDWGFVNGSAFACVGSVIWGEWMVHLCFTRTLCPSPLFPGTLLLSACFVFPNLSASAFSLLRSSFHFYSSFPFLPPLFSLNPSSSAFRSSFSVLHPSSLLVLTFPLSSINYRIPQSHIGTPTMT
ncbi:hypothetical protein C8J55DRAFT_502735 [Lentinula edodes]|uniref:Uncharacterized protein n=1 Tax=Lentinula lateritia TaxID=40482 RepID=A0A9W9AWB1_9AGAR|nr:hypothetical protein C8J55DRAFT_502735 [Lentinula edodes]